MEHLSDHGLLALVGRGDREAFARLYDMYGAAAYSLAVRIVRDRDLMTRGGKVQRTRPTQITVAAQHQDQIRARRHGIAGEFRSMAGRLGGRKRCHYAYFFQSINGTLENKRRLPPEFARDRIVDQDRLLIFSDFSSITSP